MKVSNNFDRDEFSCRCGCRFEAVDIELVGLLEKIRIRFGKPVHLNCACRCLVHNREIGSEDTSQHVRGMAADIVIQGVTPREVYDYIDTELLPDRGGVGLYDNFTHIDVREEKARWDKRGQR